MMSRLLKLLCSGFLMVVGHTGFSGLASSSEGTEPKGNGRHSAPQVILAQLHYGRGGPGPSHSYGGGPRGGPYPYYGGSHGGLYYSRPVPGPRYGYGYRGYYHYPYYGHYRYYGHYGWPYYYSPFYYGFSYGPYPYYYPGYYPGYYYGDSYPGYPDSAYYGSNQVLAQEIETYYRMGLDWGYDLQKQAVGWDKFLAMMKTVVTQAPAGDQDAFRRGFMTAYGANGEQVYDAALRGGPQPPPQAQAQLQPQSPPPAPQNNAPSTPVPALPPAVTEEPK